MLNQHRVVIENVLPQLDNGQFFIKRIIDQQVIATANVLSEGLDVMPTVVKIEAQLRY